MMHDKLYHLFVISRDMEEFAHIHPEASSRTDRSRSSTRCPSPDTTCCSRTSCRRAAARRSSATPIVTAGVETDIIAAQAKLTPDAAWDKTVDGVQGRDPQRAADGSGRRGGGFAVPLHRCATQDTPVTDLQRYLGAFGHLLILSEDMTEYVHAHPREETQPDPNAPMTGGPEVLFDALLPKPGRYRAWLQFQRGGKLTTVSFTFAAPRPGETHRSRPVPSSAG